MQGLVLLPLRFGERGSMVMSQDHFFKSIPPQVSAIDTTCAGDTYIGALVAGYSRGMTLEASLEIATKASALATTKVGAQQSIPKLSELMILLMEK